MIRAACKTFTCAARDAAWRFAPLRAEQPAAARASWRPLALCWRRKQRHSTHVVTARAATSAKHFWQPQIHLHVTAGATERTQRERTATPFQAATIHQTRVALTQNWLNAHAAAPHLSLHKLRRPERGAQAAPAARLPRQHWLITRVTTPPLLPRRLRQSERMEQANKTVRLSKRMRTAVVTGDAVSRPAPAVAAKLAPRFVLSRAAQRFEVLRPGARRVEQQQETPLSLPQQERVRPRRLPMSGGAPAPVAAVLPPAPKRRQPSLQFDREVEPPLPFDRAVELVWRQRPRAMRVAAHELASESAASLPATATPTASSVQLAQTLAAAVRGEAAAAPVTKLDPGLMDRLANDVIRRVEQRLRIERERRGL